MEQNLRSALILSEDIEYPSKYCVRCLFEDADLHAMVRIGDSPLMLVDESPNYGALGPKLLKGSPVFIHLMADDVDATVAQAVAAGAKVTMPVEDMFWGDRYGQIEDPFGHRWSVATHVRDVTPAEMQDAMKQMGG